MQHQSQEFRVIHHSSQPSTHLCVKHNSPHYLNTSNGATCNSKLQHYFFNNYSTTKPTIAKPISHRTLTASTCEAATRATRGRQQLQTKKSKEWSHTTTLTHFVLIWCFGMFCRCFGYFLDICYVCILFC